MGKPIRVLCVEDNALVSDAVGRKLTGDPDFEWLGCARTGDELARMVSELRPDVICMDLDIPGFDTLAAIRSLGKSHPGVRVVMLSGHVSTSLVDAASDAGAWGYLSKGDESRDIVAALRQVAAGEFVMGKVVRQMVQMQPGAVEPKTGARGASETPKAHVQTWNPLRDLFRRKT